MSGSRRVGAHNPVDPRGDAKVAGELGEVVPRPLKMHLYAQEGFVSSSVSRNVFENCMGVR